MSSAPVGLDVREYAYGYLPFLATGGGGWVLHSGNRWFVTKIQVYAGSVPAIFSLLNFGITEMTIQPGGCLVLEPNGAFRGDLALRGEGALLIVEFWVQARPDGLQFFPNPEAVV